MQLLHQPCRATQSHFLLSPSVRAFSKVLEPSLGIMQLHAFSCQDPFLLGSYPRLNRRKNAVNQRLFGVNLVPTKSRGIKQLIVLLMTRSLQARLLPYVFPYLAVSHQSLQHSAPCEWAPLKLQQSVFLWTAQLCHKNCERRKLPKEK